MQKEIMHYIGTSRHRVCESNFMKMLDFALSEDVKIKFVPFNKGSDTFEIFVSDKVKEIKAILYNSI